jgi:hypothetical protein
MRDPRLASRALGLAAVVAGLSLTPVTALEPPVVIENPVSVEVRFPAGDHSIPAVVAASALPRVRSSVATAPSHVFSEDTVVGREELGTDVLPDLPFWWTAGLRIECGDLDVLHGETFLEGLRSWSGLEVGSDTPDGWQGAHLTNYYQGGDVVFPEQEATPGGRLVFQDHMVSQAPVLPSSSCGKDVEAGIIADFHRVTLTAEGGDVSFAGGDELGEARLRMLSGWQGSLFGWFDPPGRRLDVQQKLVVEPGTQNPQLRLEVVSQRGGTWRRSVPTPKGRTWEWSVSGFNFFSRASEEGDQEGPADLEASMRVVPGQRIVQLLPDGDRIERRTLVAPGFGTVSLADGHVGFEEMLPRPSMPSLPTAAPREETGEQPEASGAETEAGPDLLHCTRSIERFRPEATACLSVATGAGGFHGLTGLALDGQPSAVSAALPYIEIGGVRHELRPEAIVDGPVALESQYESGSGDDPGAVLYAGASYRVGDASFTLWWLFIDDGFYGRVLVPQLISFRSPTTSTVRLGWYARPTLAGRAAIRVEEGWTGAPVAAASTWPANGGFVTGLQWFGLRDRAASEYGAYYMASGAGHHWSDLYWASHDSTTTFANWDGAPTATPVTDALTDPILGDDVAIYKQDFLESSYMARAYASSGLLFSWAPFAIGFF